MIKERTIWVLVLATLAAFFAVLAFSPVFAPAGLHAARVDGGRGACHLPASARDHSGRCHRWW